MAEDFLRRNIHLFSHFYNQNIHFPNFAANIQRKFGIRKYLEQKIRFLSYYWVF